MRAPYLGNPLLENMQGWKPILRIQAFKTAFVSETMFKYLKKSYFAV